ncbi:MAG TPA: efflux RND transporter periplasmic adaptor subunit [Nitrospirota bacterium]|nr:efflux RND transporter periplasmic adaptor subunit [Nitrospirota bacterium]
MKLRLLKRCMTLLAISLLFIAVISCTDSKAKSMSRRAVPVKTGVAMIQNVPVQINAIGNVEAYNTVSVKAMVGGEVTDVHFRQGQDVREGDLLFLIDPRPYEAALKQAVAQLARDAAQAKNAEEQAKRYDILVQMDYVSKDQYEQLRANADALAAAVQADRANVDNSRLQLAYCTIKSPLDGRVGSVLINKGNVIKANDLPLVTINKITPIYVTFSVPEQNLENIKRFMQERSLQMEAIIPGDESHPAQGVLTFINNAVDTATGTIQLKGTFENRDRRLWPGQFINVVVTLETQKNAIVIPSAALQTGQQGQYVFVVKSDSTVESRPVMVARTFGDLAVISQGVTPGEKVVTDGQLNLIPGIAVESKGDQTQDVQGKTDTGKSNTPTINEEKKK